MNNNFFDYIVYFAFENSIKCNDRYTNSLRKIHDYRVKITDLIKDNMDSIIKYQSEAVISILEDFVISNEEMSEDDEKELFEQFIKNNPKFNISGDYIILNSDVLYEDVAEVRYAIQSDSIRSAISLIFKYACDFDAYKALGCTKILDDVKKIVNVESCIENNLNVTDDMSKFIIDVGNYYVKGRLIGIANMPFHKINEYYTCISKLSGMDNIDEKLTSLLLLPETMNSELLLKHPYIDDELCNIFQQSIFSDCKLCYASLLDYFDTVWDYVYKDDAEDGINSAIEDYVPDIDENDEYFVKTNDNDLDDVSLYFYLSFIDILDNHYVDNGDNIKKRLLYALYHLDHRFNNNRYLFDKIECLDIDCESYEIEDYSDFYIMSSLFMKDILDGNIDKLTIRKILFISNYYNLTMDDRILDMIDQNNDFGRVIYNYLIKCDYDELVSNVKKKVKEKD